MYLSLGQFLGPPTPHLPPHPAAPVGTRGSAEGAALSWGSARRLEFLGENVRNDALARSDGLAWGRGGMGKGAGESGPVQLCRHRVSHSRPLPRPRPRPRPRAPRRRGSTKPSAVPRPPPRARAPGRARGAARRGERPRQPLSSLAHGTRAAAGALAGPRAEKTADVRPLTVRVWPRSTLPPLDCRGRTEGAHRGKDAPPAEPRGCLGSSWRRFPPFLSARRRRRRLLGKRKKKKKSPGQQLLESLC